MKYRILSALSVLFAKSFILHTSSKVMTVHGMPFSDRPENCEYTRAFNIDYLGNEKTEYKQDNEEKHGSYTQ